MNKKNLSVVMAGAMLATSVAPVLADTTNDNQAPQTEFEVNDSNKGLLIKELRELLTSKYFSNTENNKTFKHDGLSVYYVTMNKKIENANNADVYDATGGATKSNPNQKPYNDVKALETAIQNAAEGTKVYVYTRGYEEVTVNGKTYVNSFKADTYTKETLEAAAETAKKSEYVSDAKYYNGVLTVYLKRADQETAHNTVTLKVGDAIRDFSNPVDEAGVSTIDKNEVVDFAIDDSVKKEIKDELLYTVTITKVDNVYNVALSDLYDGLFLTDKGQELVDTLKEYDANYKARSNSDSRPTADSWYVKDNNGNGKANNGNNNSSSNPVGTVEEAFIVNKNDDGLYTISIDFVKPVAGTTNKTITNRVVITSNNESRMDLFADGIKRQKNTEGATRKFPVQVLAGSNRYETAVKVAKENADITTVSTDGNIVLVNGNSLVDGLAAAPLAASVVNGNTNSGKNTTYAAPILLTDANGLPKATKDYLKEVIAEQQVGKLDQVTIYLVGGESVISKSVENDLKEIGFRVVRAGGADREETSLKVAELMKKEGNTTAQGNTNAFLVGANGEADAMSIASVAASQKTPIIVESVHGIKEDTVEYLEGYKNDNLKNKDVTIIGGETAVSTSTENTLKAADLRTDRIAGSNRYATNAKVINTYYEDGKVNQFVVSKDGVNNKSELIDALTATSLAVKDNAPIVLGTNSISKDQLNAIENKADRNGVYVYQVGLGVARDVVSTIAERVNLAFK